MRPRLVALLPGLLPYAASTATFLQIAGGHGDHNELQMRLHRMLERDIDDSPEASREHMRTMGFDCGYDSLAFELVLESLKAECVIQEDEGDLWRQ